MTAKKKAIKKPARKKKADSSRNHIAISSCNSVRLPEATLKKHLSGRPTKYKPEFCDKIKELMAEGKSFATAAVELGIRYETLTTWKNPSSDQFKIEFSKAIKEGEELSKRWWEEQGRTNLNNKDFNSTLYMMNMQNRHGWTRKLEGKITKEEITTERKELNINIRTEEHVAEVTRILAESGAIESITEGSAEEQVN